MYTPSNAIIIVHEDVWKAIGEDRVQSVVNWINHVVFECFYPIESVNYKAVEVYYVDYYITEIGNGGIAQLISNSKMDPKVINAIKSGINRFGSSEHKELFSRIEKKLSESKMKIDALRDNGPFNEESADEEDNSLFHDEESLFFELEKRDNNLTVSMDNEIAKWDFIRVLSDSDFDREWDKYAILDSVRRRRKDEYEALVELEGSELCEKIESVCKDNGLEVETVSYVGSDRIDFTASGNQCVAKFIDHKVAVWVNNKLLAEFVHPLAKRRVNWIIVFLFYLLWLSVASLAFVWTLNGILYWIILAAFIFLTVIIVFTTKSVIGIVFRG